MEGQTEQVAFTRPTAGVQGTGTPSRDGATGGAYIISSQSTLLAAVKLLTFKL